MKAEATALSPLPTFIQPNEMEAAIGWSVVSADGPDLTCHVVGRSNPNASSAAHAETKENSKDKCSRELNGKSPDEEAAQSAADASPDQRPVVGHSISRPPECNLLSAVRAK